MSASAVIGMLIPLALYLAYSALQSMFPPPPPLVVTDVRSYDTPRNTWMVSGHAAQPVHRLSQGLR
jgi:hypothetical protein